MTSRAPASKAAWAALIALAAAIPFLPSLWNGWINWDDYPAIRDNPMLSGFSAESLRWMFTTFHLGHYQPLAWLTLGLDRALWGSSPAAVHASSLAYHAASAALYFLLARELLALARPADAERPRSIAAAFAALAFAAHPLRVESVVWATERRDVLCELFTLATLLSYVRDRARGGSGVRPLTLGLYALALGSKVFAAALPGALLALDFYPLRRLSKRRPLELLPFAAMAALALALGLAAQASTPALLSFSEFGPLRRLGQAAYAVAFYPAKTLFPVGLSAWYGDAMDPPRGEALAGGVFFFTVTAALWRLRGSRPALLAAWAAYLSFVLPASGLVKSASQVVADRYSYLSCLPFPLLAAGGALSLSARRRAFAWAASGLIVAALGASTWRQTGYWRTSATLWTRACAMNPQSPYPRTQLILARLEQERPDLALEELARLPRRPPPDDAGYDALAARVLNNAGVQLSQQGRLEEAEAAFLASLELEPRLQESRRNLRALRAAARRRRASDGRDSIK